MIGLGITTRNRNKILPGVLSQWQQYSPEGIEIIVVDDGSLEPVKEATFRFDQNVGIPVAKNKCLELLEHHEHIFLADDDCFPVKDGWEKAYIRPGIKHLSFTFPTYHDGRDNHQRGFMKEDNGLNYFKQPCGCFLYIHRSCLEVVGGMDTNYKGWGAEHVDYSTRIYNAGLTPHPFMDISNSLEYICSLDYYAAVESVSWDNRNKYGAANAKRKAQQKNSKQYYPYK